MKKLIFHAGIFLLLLHAVGCTRNKEVVLSNKDIADVVTRMTDIMVHDVTNPPLASRFFAYACLSGYEIVAQNSEDCKSLQGVLKDYPVMSRPDSVQRASYPIAAVLAMLETAKKMQPSGSRLDQYEQRWMDSLIEAGANEEIMEQSLRYATAISTQMLAYAKNDGYHKISNYKRYTPVDKEGHWYPTPPAYIAAVEPYFNTIRSFTLDSCSQFKPAEPVAFSLDKNSTFFKLMQQNYEDSLTSEHRAIAAFWDCNPFAVEDDGHMMIGLKKISPGAHWLAITGAACRKANKSFSETMNIYTQVSVGLMDGFICCWDEKYRSNRIRPETAIRKYIDARWQPLLQTPPFPEYLSGHSVISAASATVLTYFFGASFSFTDSTELMYGLPPRSFTSFSAAAKEAGISRFYGGIHFMDAVDNGLDQGEKVGAWVVQKMNATTARLAVTTGKH